MIELLPKHGVCKGVYMVDARKARRTFIIFFVRINNARSKPFSVILPINRFWFLHYPTQNIIAIEK